MRVNWRRLLRSFVSAREGEAPAEPEYIGVVVTMENRGLTPSG